MATCEHGHPDCPDGDSDFCSIERQADVLFREGYLPQDSEPGEWLVMYHPGLEDTITITPQREEHRDG